jgi:hypothetical protein
LSWVHAWALVDAVADGAMVNATKRAATAVVIRVTSIRRDRNEVITRRLLASLR